MLKKFQSSILACCGYGINVNKFVHNIIVYGDDEKELDAFLALGEEQNALLKGIKGVSWKFKNPTDGFWYGNYVIPVNTLDFDAFVDSSKIVIPEKKLEYREADDAWYVTGGTQPLTCMTQAQLSIPISELTAIPGMRAIVGFGNRVDLYSVNKASTLACSFTPQTTYGVAFMDAQSSWVQQELDSLRAEFNILVDCAWHNPRYLGPDHDLHTMIFTRK